MSQYGDTDYGDGWWAEKTRTGGYGFGSGNAMTPEQKDRLTVLRTRRNIRQFVRDFDQRHTARELYELACQEARALANHYRDMAREREAARIAKGRTPVNPSTDVWGLKQGHPLWPYGQSWLVDLPGSPDTMQVFVAMTPGTSDDDASRAVNKLGKLLRSWED